MMAGPSERAGFILPPEKRACRGRSHQTFLILNIIKHVPLRPPHPQQHPSRVGESNGQISRFWVLPPSLLLHREDGEDHLEGAQHLNAQSLSRIQLQGDLGGGEQRGAEGPEAAQVLLGQ